MGGTNTAGPLEDFLIWCAAQKPQEFFDPGTLKQDVEDWLHLAGQMTGGDTRQSQARGDLPSISNPRLRMSILAQGVAMTASGAIDWLNYLDPEPLVLLPEKGDTERHINAWHRNFHGKEVNPDLMRSLARDVINHRNETGPEIDRSRMALLCETVATVLSGRLGDFQTERKAV